MQTWETLTGLREKHGQPSKMSKRKASYGAQSTTAKKARTSRNTTLAKSKVNNRYVAKLYTYPMPQKIWTELRCRGFKGLISSTTSGAAFVYQPTSYFDLDPALGGPSFGGYSFFAGMYNRYRVLSFKYKVTFVNLESSAATVSCQAIASTSVPGTGAGTDWTQAAMENDYGKYVMLAPTSSTPERTLSGYVSCVKLWGTPEAKYDAGWAATIGTSPSLNSYLRVAGHLNSGANLSTGVQIVIEITSYGYWDTRASDIVS